MIDTQLPCAIFVSDFADPEVLTSEILKNQGFPQSNFIAGNIKAYPWKIDTKYYQTTVNLCPVKNDVAIPEAVLSLMEAVVMYFDNKSLNSFENIKKWFNDIKDDSPEILLLVCDSFKDNPADSVSRTTATNWCLQYGFELIELNDTDVDDNNDYSIIPEKRGVERVVEALHTHMWPNLDMKTTSNSNGGQANGHNGSYDEFNPDDTLDDFCELFSQLHTMKESISSLPLRDRRVCAEQVVSTFWKAIGGDNEEIDELPES